MSVRLWPAGNYLSYLVQGVLSLFLLWMNQSCSGRLRSVLLLTISPRPSKKVRTVVSSSSTESDILAQSTQSRASVSDLRRPKMNRGKFLGCLIIGHRNLIICTEYRSLSWPKDLGRLVGPDGVPLVKITEFRAWE